MALRPETAWGVSADLYHGVLAPVRRVGLSVGAGVHFVETPGGLSAGVGLYLAFPERILGSLSLRTISTTDLRTELSLLVLR